MRDRIASARTARTFDAAEHHEIGRRTDVVGIFPNDAAVIKLLWLAICTIEDKRARQRHKERGKPAAGRKAPGRLVEGRRGPTRMPARTSARRPCP